MPDLGTSAEVTSLHAQLAREEACRASVASVLAVKILVTDATLKRVSAVHWVGTVRASLRRRRVHLFVIVDRCGTFIDPAGPARAP